MKNKAIVNLFLILSFVIPISCCGIWGGLEPIVNSDGNNLPVNNDSINNDRASYLKYSICPEQPIKFNLQINWDQTENTTIYYQFSNLIFDDGKLLNSPTSLEMALNDGYFQIILGDHFLSEETTEERSKIPWIISDISEKSNIVAEELEINFTPLANFIGQGSSKDSSNIPFIPALVSQTEFQGNNFQAFLDDPEGHLDHQEYLDHYYLVQVCDIPIIQTSGAYNQTILVSSIQLAIKITSPKTNPVPSMVN